MSPHVYGREKSVYNIDFFPGGEAGDAGGAVQDGCRDGREVRGGAQDGEEEAPERGEALNWTRFELG